MSLKTTGISSKLNIASKPLLFRVLAAIVLSNIFFYLLFMNSDETEAQVLPPDGWVQIQIKADSRTPFQSGKKVLLVDRQRGMSLEAVLEIPPSETEEHFTISVKEEEASEVLRFKNWEIIPYLKKLTLSKVGKRVEHEIHY